MKRYIFVKTYLFSCRMMPHERRRGTLTLTETRDGEFNLDESLGYRLLITMDAITKVVSKRYSQELGLEVHEGRILTVIRRFGPLSTGEIAQRAHLSKPKVSRTIQLFIARGLVNSQPHPDDNRLVKLTLTPHGNELHDRVVPIILEVEAELRDAVGASTRADMMAALDRIRHRLL